LSFETDPIGHSGTSPKLSQVIIEAAEAREKQRFLHFPPCKTGNTASSPENP
jgi:hypothetical protein